MTTILVSLDKILSNSFQTRHQEPDPAYIKELALSIAANGLLQIPVGRLFAPDLLPPDPDLVIKTSGDIGAWQVQLAFGHNRLAAHKWLYDLRDNSDIPGNWSCMLVDLRPLSDVEMANFAWDENEARRSHTALDRALAIKQRIETFGWTQEKAGNYMRLSRSSISNALRMLDLPEEPLQALGRGDLSERQAMALLPMYSLPADILAKAEDSPNYSYMAIVKPSKILEKAIEGDSSDNLRHLVEELMNHYGQRLSGAIWPLDDNKIFEPFVERFPALLPVSCPGCAHLVGEKKDRICLNPTCFTAKEQAWKLHRLTLASQACGLPILEEDLDSAYVTHFGRYDHDQEKYDAIRAAQCENLRLYFDKYHRGESEMTSADPKYPEIRVVCKKRSGFCSCLAGLKAMDAQPAISMGSNGSSEEAETESAPAQPVTSEDLKEASRQAKREEREAKKLTTQVKERAVEILAEALGDDIVGAWEILADRIEYGIRKSEYNDLLSIRLIIANKLVSDYSVGSKAMDYIDSINRMLSKAGLEIVDIADLEPEESVDPAKMPAME